MPDTSTTRQPAPTHAVPPAADPADGQITVQTVQHLATLARIELSDDELQLLSTQINSIVQHIATVSEMTRDDVPPTSHPIPINTVMRPDTVADVLTRDQALANAPDASDGMFRVPSILGEEQ